MLGLGLGIGLWSNQTVSGGGGSSGATTFSLNFATPSYTVGGTSYGSSLSSIPGYSYTRSGSIQVLNNDGTIGSFAANTVPINGYGLHHYDALTNLLLQSSAFDTVANWTAGSITVTANTTTAPDGTTTADTLTASNSTGSFRQAFNTTGQKYTFSFFAMRGTATDLKYGAYDFGTSSPIVAQTSYYSQTNGSTFSRIVVPPFTGSSTGQTGVYPSWSSAAGTEYLWQAQCLNANLPDGGPIIPTTTAAASTGAATLSFSMANGTYSVTYTFDDNSTQVVSQTVSSGTFTLMTAPTLNRGRIKSVSC